MESKGSLFFLFFGSLTKYKLILAKFLATFWLPFGYQWALFSQLFKNKYFLAKKLVTKTEQQEEIYVYEPISIQVQLKKDVIIGFLSQKKVKYS